MLNPRQFLDQYVMPCVTDWQLDPLNIRKAIIAISQIDILADHVIIHQHPGFTRVQLANVSGLIASTGHSGTHTPQSMHSSGWMTSMFSPS